MNDSLVNCFFFTAPATTEIYTLSLHDALPIWRSRSPGPACGRRSGRRSRPTKGGDRKSTRLNSSHSQISYAVFCLKKKNKLQSILIPHLPSRPAQPQHCVEKLR